MKFTPEQDRAAQAIELWAKDPWAPPLFKLQGYAGTGKTSMVIPVTQNLSASGIRVVYCAPTGKAASVLRGKGVMAQTIHSLIYSPASRMVCKFCQEAVAGSDDEVVDLPKCPVKKRLHEDGDLERRIGWNFKRFQEIGKSTIVVVDEASMVGDREARNLLEKCGARVLAVGDPFQLAPVKNPGGDSLFVRGEPDAMLTSVQRQSEGSDVLELATHVRKKLALPKTGTYGDSLVLPTARLRPDTDTLTIVGRNNTRHSLNRACRKALGYRRGDPPEPGEPLICLSNNFDQGVANGETFRVGEDGTTWDWERPDEWYDVHMVSADGHDNHVRAWQKPFDMSQKDEESMKSLDFKRAAEALQMTYAYAITAHKSQGSEWPDVTVIDEGWVFRRGGSNERWRWLYTAITRAKQRITLGV